MVVGSWSKLDIDESQILPISMAESGFGEQETARRDPLNAAKSLKAKGEVFGEQTKTASPVRQHGNSVHLEHLPKASSDIVEKRCRGGRFGILFGFTSGQVLHSCPMHQWGASISNYLFCRVTFCGDFCRITFFGDRLRGNRR